MFRGIKERIIRLSGKNSDVTNLSLKKYKNHILPVFEKPNLH